MKMENWLIALAFAAPGLTGCDDAGYQDYSNAPLSEGHDHGHHHDHHHGHGDSHSAHQGKHGGHVLELDDAHGHHAELIFDKATRNITLYFYGSEIGVAKAATGLAFEIQKDGKDVVLEAKALPLDGETELTASRFVVAGSQLPEAIQSEEQLDGHFHVTIDGHEFIGEFHAHSHDEHAADDHSAGDHAAGDPAHDDHKDEKSFGDDHK